LKTIFFYCSTFAFVPILVATIIGGIRYCFAVKHEKYLIVLMGFCLLTEVGTSILWHLEMNNLWISHLLAPVELMLLLRYYGKEFNRNFAQVLNAMGIGFLLFVTTDSLFFHSPFEMNAVSKTTECIVLVLLSLIMWMKIMRDMELKKLTSAPMFWVNSAVLMYFSTTILLFIFSRSILESPELAIWIWMFHLFFMTLYYVLFSIGLWKIRPVKHL
jgi:hypothetical protein